MSDSHSIELIVKALRGRRIGDSWQCHCPAHDDRTPSLSVTETADGVLLLYCHAGCSQTDVISALKDRGLWTSGIPSKYRPTAGPSRSQSIKEREEKERKTTSAMRTWKQAVPADGSLVQTYLGERGITIPVPPRIRFMAKLYHSSGISYPAMVALVTGGLDDRPLGIHRTWLDVGGLAKAPLEDNKKMLGPCKWGAVRLSPVGQPLLIGEGIETTLSVMQATGLAGWAALSTSGLGALELPPDALEIVILADGDDPGEAAARAAAERWQQEGRQVRIARPPNGVDFNDLLLSAPDASEDHSR